MNYIIFGILFVLFLLCIYKIAGLREQIKLLEKKARAGDLELADAVDKQNTYIRILDNQLMSLRFEFNEFKDSSKKPAISKSFAAKAQEITITKFGKNPPKKKAYGKKSK